MAVLGLVMFVAMFLVVFVLRTVVQKRRTGDSGIRAGVLSSSAWSIEWVAGWLLVLALLAALVAPLAEIAGLDPLTTNSWVRGTGIVVGASGIVLTFLAQLGMGTQWRIGIDADEATELVTDGFFAIVRNPIFSALTLAASGLALMVPNPFSIAGSVLLVVAIELQVRAVEEPYLRTLHGPSYARYESRVGRFVPFAGRSRQGFVVGLGSKVPIHSQARSHQSRSASVSPSSSDGTDE